MHSWRYAIGSCSSPGELNIINKLRPVVLNLGKDLLVSYKILKGSCTDVPDPRIFLLEDAIAGSIWFLLIVVTWVVGIAFCLFKNIFFAIFRLLWCTYLETAD